MRQIFLDTETTGLSPEAGDRIVEIGCIEMDGRRLTGRHKHFYLNPDRSSHPDALRIHGLTDEFLADKPRFADIVQELVEFCDGAEIIIHNAAFDMGFINHELMRTGRAKLNDCVHSVTDSLLMAREIYPGKANSLDALCKRLEVDNSNRTFHGALLDAGLLAEVYIRMTRGQGMLVVDHVDAGGDALSVDMVDLSSFTLPVLLATADELAEHDSVLAELDKASKGNTLWHQMEPAVSA